jgi:hypothetical protein
MFELIPGKGLVLPRGAGLLTADMPEQNAHYAVAVLGEVREGWMNGTGWTFAATYGGLEIRVVSDGWDERGVLPGRGPGLTRVVLARHSVAPTQPSVIPVVLDGVDVFGRPEADVLRRFAPGSRPGVRLLSAETAGCYLPELWFEPNGGSQPAR